MALLTFPRFVTAASAASLALFVAQWAAASPLTDEGTAFDLCIDAHDPEAEHDVAEIEALCAAEAASVVATEDVDAYNLALRDVDAAPEFCVVTYIEPDVTHGWRAVCVLDTDDATPAPVPFRMAGAL